jgi:hypothetical protein
MFAGFKLFSQEEIKATPNHMQEHIHMKGGVITVEGSLVIDATLEDVTINSKSGMVHLSSIANLKECKINCTDFMTMGHFEGEVYAKGRTELAGGSVTIGYLQRGDELYVSRLADADSLQIKAIPKSEATKLQVVNSNS